VRLQTAGGVLIAEHIEVATTLWQRFVGLMGRHELPAGHGLWIQPCSSIHMFFMRFAIDAVFVDGDGRVLRIYPTLKPWRATWFVGGAKAVIELPSGAAAAAGISAGDTVKLGS
jgi:uncharacterized membrane protein (UPF0127 family)